MRGHAFFVAWRSDLIGTHAIEKNGRPLKQDCRLHTSCLFYTYRAFRWSRPFVGLHKDPKACSSLDKMLFVPHTFCNRSFSSSAQASGLTTRSPCNEHYATVRRVFMCAVAYLCYLKRVLSQCFCGIISQTLRQA